MIGLTITIDVRPQVLVVAPVKWRMMAAVARWSAAVVAAIAFALKDGASMTGQVVRRSDYGQTWQ